MSSWGRSEAHQRHVDDAERELERHRRREERRLRRLEEQGTVEALRAEMQQEIASLRAEMQQAHDIASEAAGEALGEYGNKICDHLEKISATSRAMAATEPRRLRKKSYRSPGPLGMAAILVPAAMVPA
jgi:hypothetical protein